MNKKLPTALFYEHSKQNEINEILKNIYQISIQNPKVKINSSIVYNYLHYGLLPKEESDGHGHGKSNRQFFEKWSRDFAYKRSINAFCDVNSNPFWFQFNNDLHVQDNYIKIYLSIKSTHLYKSVLELFSFLEEQNIVHLSQVAQESRLDNVIIRLRANDTESLAKIIDYVNSNKYIKSGLNENIPFTPTIRGVGVINEHGYSYGSDISVYINNYIEQCINFGLQPSCTDFENYLKTYCVDKDIIESFENAVKDRNEFKIRDKRTAELGLSLEQKTYLFIDAMKATYVKYGLDQVIGAVKAAFKNDYSKFTNGNYLKIRERLQKNITIKDIKQIIKYTLSNFPIPSSITKDMNLKIETFCKLLFSQTAILSLDEACLATVEKYGENYLVKAIRKYINYNDPTGFTRFIGNSDVNHRKTVMHINRKNILGFLKRSLQLKGYDINDERDKDIPSIYASSISNSRYTSIANSPILSK